MDVGLAIIFQGTDKSRSDLEVYQQELRLGSIAESLGYQSIWGVEHHFTDYTMCPDVLQMLTYFAAKAKTFGTQRIGLTSPTRRVVPMTRDYQYAAGQFGTYAELAQQQADPVVGATAAGFAPPVSYVDYAPSIDDVLALCMTGFPSFEDKSTHRRTLIYLGPSSIRAPGETRPALFVSQRVTDMAKQAGIQINAITTSSRGREAGLRSIGVASAQIHQKVEGGIRSLTQSRHGALLVRLHAAIGAACLHLRTKPPRAKE